MDSYRKQWRRYCFLHPFKVRRNIRLARDVMVAMWPEVTHHSHARLVAAFNLKKNTEEITDENDQL